MLFTLFFLSCEQKSLEETGNSVYSYIGLIEQYVDVEAPVISLFSTTGPNPTVTPLVPLNSDAADDVGITGWMITEAPVVPDPGDAGWLDTRPVSYTLSAGYGAYTLYLWAKDLTGNVSQLSATSQFSITYIDTTLPTVTIDQAGTQGDPATALPILFTVAFSEAINPATFTAADVTQSGTATGVTWTLSTSDNITWTLSATALLSSGTVVPTIAASMVQDQAGNPSNASSSTDNSVTFNYPAPALATGQTICYNESGVSIACAGTGQDGELQTGVPWTPAARFTDNGLTMTDNLTGLVWTKNANLSGSVTWDNAFTHIATLNAGPYGGRSDWRLPNIVELMSIMYYGSSSMSAWLSSFGFTVSSTTFWSSTTYNNILNEAWCFDVESGSKNYTAKMNAYNAWAVAGTSTNLPKTGQTICYNSSGVIITCPGTGQDGELQMGVSWPSPRFTDNLDGTITDNLTGLMWAEDANDMAATYPSFDTDLPLGNGVVTWQHALDYVTMLNGVNYLGYSDWRLPNFNELMSLQNQGDGLNWLTTSGFINADALTQVFWSSTTYEASQDYAKIVNDVYGVCGSQPKTSINYFTWPVRAGN